MFHSVGYEMGEMCFLDPGSASWQFRAGHSSAPFLDTHIAAMPEGMSICLVASIQNAGSTFSSHKLCDVDFQQANPEGPDPTASSK